MNLYSNRIIVYRYEKLIAWFDVPFIQQIWKGNETRYDKRISIPVCVNQVWFTRNLLQLKQGSTYFCVIDEFYYWCLCIIFLQAYASNNVVLILKTNEIFIGALQYASVNIRLCLLLLSIEKLNTFCDIKHRISEWRSDRSARLCLS